VPEKLNTEELLPCPFCNSTVELISRPGNLYKFVQCPSCLVLGPKAYGDEFAVKKWNTRYIPEGYKLVPIEPTEAMKDATQSLYYNSQTPPKDIYKAMLEAAQG